MKEVLLSMIVLVAMMISCSVPKMEQHESKYLLLSQFSTIQECLDYAEKNNIDSVLFDICLSADTIRIPEGIIVKGTENVFVDKILYEKMK